MLKAVLAGTAALAIAGSTLVYAQQRGDRPEGLRRGAPTAQEMQAFADARLAALKAGLALTAEQQANWPAFEAAARDVQKLRMDRMAALAERRDRAQAQDTDLLDRLRQRGTTMADTGAALKKLADAAEPLYKSLDDSQKRRFTALARIGDPRNLFAARGGRDDDRRGFGGRDDRDFRGGRDFHRGPGERFGGRDFRDGPGFRGDRFGGRDFRDRDFRDERDPRGDRFGGREFRGDRFGRDFRDERDFRGPRGFRDGREDYGYEPRGYGRGPRGGDDGDSYRRGPSRPFGGPRFEREDL